MPRLNDSREPMSLTIEEFATYLVGDEDDCRKFLLDFRAKKQKGSQAGQQVSADVA